MHLAILAADSGSTLPVWATVVLGLVGGGAVGGMVTAWMQSSASERKEWQTRLLSAADDFVQTFWIAHGQLSDLLDLSYKIQGGELRDEIDLSDTEHQLLVETEPLLRDVMLKLSRVALLFGGSSSTAEAAREARKELQRAYNSLDPQPDYPFADTSKAKDLLNKAERANDRFATAARAAAIRARRRRWLRPAAS